MRIFLILILLMPEVVGGQGSKPTLLLKFDLKNDSVCAGESIDFDLTMTNSSRSDLVVDVARIGSLTAFAPWGEDAKDGGIGSVLFDDQMPTHYKPQFVILQPAQVYTVSLRFKLKDRPALRNGNYRMKIGYQQSLNRTVEDIKVWKGIIYSKPRRLVVKKC